MQHTPFLWKERRLFDAALLIRKRAQYISLRFESQPLLVLTILMKAPRILTS